MRTRLPLTQARLKQYRKLTEKKHRQREQKFIIEGSRSVVEALESEWSVEAILIAENVIRTAEYHRLERLSNVRDVPIFIITEDSLAKLSDTVTPQGILGIITIREIVLSDLLSNLPQCSCIVALEGVSDPGNVGTLIRTCDWFGVSACLLDRDTAELYNPKVVRATMGSLFHLPIAVDVDLIQAIRQAKRAGIRVITTVLKGGIGVSANLFSDRCLIVLGNEARGVSPEVDRLADQRLTIPRYGRAESLNVAIAGAIVLAAIRSR